MKSTALRWFLLLSLVGCAEISENIKDSVGIEHQQGIVVFTTKSLDILHLQFVDYSPDKNASISVPHLPSNTIFINQPTQTWVLKMDAGKHMWGGVITGESVDADFSGQNEFNVKKGKVNYLGELTIMVLPGSDGFAQISVIDNMGHAKEYMRQQYPKLMSNLPMVNSLTSFHY